MDPDELKSAWQSLDRRLQQHNAIHLQLFRDSRLDKARSRLRPLFWGQIAQILFGLAFVLLAGVLWSRQPDAPHLVIAGVLVQLYGIVTIALAGGTLGKISAIDYAAPVLTIQKQLGALRQFYMHNGMVIGLSWWVLWVPVIMVLAGVTGGDLYARSPLTVWCGLGVGVLGLLATWGFHRWAHHPSRARLGQRLDDNAAGGSIRRTQSLVEEIARFEQE
ncbi:serine/threonine protein kinase [Luteimonas aquatica]|uniref:serine/threonine protein kinase n=1 Tax=Luteimonas aquatica TaxID=450364 RepID=UPI001F574FCD|nr:serine/threonine protein kinase [Luteimonas aquatica]